MHIGLGLILLTPLIVSNVIAARRPLNITLCIAKPIVLLAKPSWTNLGWIPYATQSDLPLLELCKRILHFYDQKSE